MSTTNRWWRDPRWQETRFTLAVACVALLAYIVTLSRGVFPGESANLMVRTLDLVPRDTPAHPFWTLLVRLVSKIPLGPLPLRLNLISAVCGAAALALFFRLMFRGLFETARCVFWEWMPVLPQESAEEQEQEQEPETDDLGPECSSDPTVARKETVIGDSDRRTTSAALLGALTATAALAFAAPFWSACVSLHFQTFDLLVLLLACSLLESYTVHGRPELVFFTACVCGAGVVESISFVLAAPLILFLLVRAFAVHRNFSEGNVFLVLFGGLLGMGAGVLALRLSCVGQTGAGLPIQALVLALAHAHRLALLQALPHVGWLLILAPTVIPGLVVLFGARHAFSMRLSTEQRLLWVLVNLLLTFVVAGCLLNLSFSPWTQARAGGHLPVLLSLIVALTTGFLVTYWRLHGRLNDSFGVNLVTWRTHRISRAVGLASCALLIVVVAATPITNFSDADARKGDFADAFAREVIANLGDRLWLASDGLLDPHLIIQARLQRRDLTVVSLGEPLTPRRQQQIWTVVAGPAALGRPSNACVTDTAAFLSACLVARPEAAARGAVINAPGVWTQAGFTPVSDGLVYTGMVPQMQPQPVETLMVRQRALWDRLEAVFAASGDRPPYLALPQALLRRLTGRMANDLGVLLEHFDNPQEAYEAYNRALRLDADNPSAALNLLALCRGGSVDDDGVQAGQRVRLLSQRFGPEVSLFNLTRCYGFLRRQDQAELASVGDRSPTGSNVWQTDMADNIYTQWMALCVTSTPGDGGAAAKARKLANAAATRELQAAALAIEAGHLTAAESILRLVTSRQPERLPAWSMLAEVLFQRGQTNLVEQDVLPAMHRASGTNDHVLVKLVQARLLRSRQPVDFAAVRTLLRQALEQYPDLAAVRDDLLRVDFQSGDAAAIETDAVAALARKPDDAFYNYLLANVRFDAGDMQRAEQGFRHSLASHATVAARTKLAEILRQRRCFAEAEQEARLAVRDGAGFSESWRTLGCILFDEGRVNEAGEALDQALSLHGTDPRIHLVLARVRVAQGRVEDALRELRGIDVHGVILPSDIHLEVAALERQLKPAAGKDAF